MKFASPLGLNNYVLYLSSFGDLNHSLRYDDNIDGPVLRGYSGVRVETAANSKGFTVNGDGDVYFDGGLYALSFSGDGSQLSGLNAGNISGGTINAVHLPTSVVFANISSPTNLNIYGLGDVTLSSSNYVTLDSASDCGLALNPGGGPVNVGGHIYATYGMSLGGSISAAGSISCAGGTTNLTAGTFDSFQVGVYGFRLTQSNTVSYGTVSLYNNTALNNNVDRGIHLDQNGYLGIGKAPTARLDVNGDANIVGYQKGGNIKAFCVATMGGQNFTSGFQTVNLTKVTDLGSNFSNTTHFYTVPVTGVYEITTKLRVNDGYPSGISYGQGVHSSNIDGPWFLWASTNGNREGSINVRKAVFNAGDQIRMYAYIDSAGTIFVGAAEMTVELVGI
ncbi:MAG TPA: hypothetical protein VF595_05920 [Tepidisphaeraceae bacterium]|jgi:hypothetical protein